MAISKGIEITCDRCGKKLMDILWTKYDLTKIRFNSLHVFVTSRYDFEHEIDHRDYDEVDVDTYDLCPDCCKKFVEWIKKEEEK